MKKKKKMEFSKKMFIAISLLVIFIVIFCFIMMWRTNDLSPMIYLIPAAFGELATATGFYYSKAKKENEIKLKKHYGKKMATTDKFDGGDLV